MQVKFLKKSNLGYKFLLQSTRYDIVNAIRRAIVGHVPTYSVDKVLIYKNESVMPDEFLAHRLGLVPVNVRDFDNDKDLSLYLKKTSGMVKSGDIETNGVAEIVLKNIPLVLLNEGKELEVELVLKKGTGEVHTKWSPALVFYNNVPEIKHATKVDKEMIKTCPRGLLEFKGSKIVLRDPYDCDACKFCEVNTNRELNLSLKEDEFVFTIEPYGNLDIDLIVKNSVVYLNSELDEFAKEIKSLK